MELERDQWAEMSFTIGSRSGIKSTEAFRRPEENRGTPHSTFPRKLTWLESIHLR